MHGKNYSNGLKIVRTCNILGVLLGIFSGLILLAFSNIITVKWLGNKISPTPFYLIALVLPFIALSSSISGYFSAIRKAYKNAISQCLELLIKIFISIFLLKFYPVNNLEIICIYLILADVISEVFSGVFLFTLYKHNMQKYHIKIAKKFEYKKRILKIMIPVSITSYIRSGLSTVKQFIVPNRLLAYGLPYTIALAEYGKITGMALPIIMFPLVFISSFSNLLIPEFASLLAKNYIKRIRYISKKIFILVGFFSLSISFLIFIYSNEISLMIFQNIDCAIYIRMLSPLILFIYLDNVIDNILKGLNQQFNVMLCNILDLILSIFILYFLLPKIGITGFIITIYISEIFNFLISYFVFYKTVKFNFSKKY